MTPQSLRPKSSGAAIWMAGATLLLWLILLATGAGRAQQPAAPAPDGRSLPEVLEAIERTRVVTRILYVTAHPDDEPGALLAYLARGLHADVALLSLTRGEGGQNALGPEQGPRLGVIRSEELLRATQVYGTRLFFTRASDFGYSKTPEETLKLWGDAVVDDMVRVIRTFRPHVIINNWGGVRSGHGHHQAAGLLTPRAYELAANPAAFPAQLEQGLRSWKAASLLQLARGTPAATGPQARPEGFEIPVNERSPLWGKTWSEIGIEGYLNHRSQGVAGFRNSAFTRRRIALVRVDGAPPDRDTLAAPLSSLASRYESASFRAQIAAANQSTEEARFAAARGDWPAALGSLARAGKAISMALGELNVQPREAVADLYRDVSDARERIDRALAAVCAIRLEAEAERSDLVPGETLVIRISESHRTDLPVLLREPELVTPSSAGGVRGERESSSSWRFSTTVERLTKPAADFFPWMFPFVDLLYGGAVRAEVDNYAFRHEVPARALRFSSTRADAYPLRLVPAVSLTLSPQSLVLLTRNSARARTLELVVRVRHYSTKKESITVGLESPPGWTAPPTQSLDFDGAGDRLARFVVPVPARLTPGRNALKAFARRDSGEEFRTSLEPLPSLPTRLWEEPAEAQVHVMDVALPPKLRVGYVAADNDPIPPALQQIGIQVEPLDEVALAFADLSPYDAICVGIRAYELRQDLPRANRRLLDYAAAGGTLVVQYQRDSVWNSLQPAPYPARITEREARVTDETAPVRLLVPEHPVLNFPNGISPRDFDGWTQERGLYFWGEMDSRYVPLLAMKDPADTQESRGALVVAPYGKGFYVFTGLSFFRQLPEGVPGAYRLFINLLSQSALRRQ